jgi:hypothetical protein
MNNEYMLVQDQSSHWYLIPADRRPEWDAWSELDEDDEAAWDAPEFAVPVNGNPSRVVFSGPWKTR